jgi:Tfp pilus assembly PilM family ATPase
LAFRYRLATGIHIIDNVAYIVVLESRRRQIFLKGLIQAQLPGPFNGQRLADDGACSQMAQFLAHIGHVEGFRLRNAYMALDNREVFLKRRPLGEEDEDSQYEQLQWEAEYFLPSDPNEYGIDFLLTPFGGFVIAAQRRLLSLYVDLYRRAGIRNLGLDIVPFALYNALEQMGNLGEQRVDLLLDIRSTESQVILLDCGHVRALDILRWESEMADTYKLDELVERVQKILRDEIDIDVPHHLWLTGNVDTGGFWHSELEQRLSVVAHVLDPFLDLDTSELDDEAIPLLDQGPVFTVAAGLAYRCLSE